MHKKKSKTWRTAGILEREKNLRSVREFISLYKGLSNTDSFKKKSTIPAKGAVESTILLYSDPRARTNMCKGTLFSSTVRGRNTLPNIFYAEDMKVLL